MAMKNPKGDRKGPRSTPLLSRPYKDAERFRLQYLFLKDIKITALPRLLRLMTLGCRGLIMDVNFLIGILEHPAGPIMKFNDQVRSYVVTPPRSEGSVWPGTEILRCAQDDRTESGW